MLPGWLQFAVGLDGLDWPEPLIRLVLAAVLGGLVGLEREIRGRHAGFRTNLLVSLGCGLAMIVSVSFAHTPWPRHDGVNVTVDPARVAYGVMAGVGFLGAGVIVKHRGGVHGLTTAAGLWCVAAVGLACGRGLYAIATVATVLVLAGLWFMARIERHLPKVRFRTLVIRRPWQAGAVRETVEMLGARRGVSVGETSYHRVGDLSVVEIRLSLSVKGRRAFEELERELDGRAGYEVVSVDNDP